MFTEIYCLKYPNKCMQLLQYSGLLNNLVGKFPFSQVYMYDKEFCLELQQLPSTPWNVIDTQLWSKCLHGINTMGSFRQEQQQPTMQQHKKATKVDWPFQHCFAHSRGGCTHPSCNFPHVCGWCGMYSHTTNNCASKSGGTSGQQQPTYPSSTTQQHNTAKTASYTRGVRPTYPSQGGQTPKFTTQLPAEN